MDFSSMNGYEFEEFITKLLSNLGFEARQTSLSGDGGVDIEAYCDKPFLKGYYLIQCKNWANPVGQPQVRDLYGVVMSKRANKGILVTTSSFTDQARDFANGLNVELIDGQKLNEIAMAIDSQHVVAIHGDNCFIHDASFDADRYTYLRKKMESKRDYNSYEEYLAFLLSYVQPQSFYLLKQGLDEEIIAVCNDIHSRFCKNQKRDIAKRDEHIFIKSYVFFVTGKIAACIEGLNELGLFEFNRRTDSYVPCRSEWRNCWTPEYVQPKDAVVMDVKYDKAWLFYADCTRWHVMIANLFILANKIGGKELAEFRQFLNKGLTSHDFMNKDHETKKVVYYLADFTLQAINQNDQTPSYCFDYKWYPYYFTLKKDVEYSVENTCYYGKAVSVKDTLVDSWGDLLKIKNDINDMGRMLGLFTKD